MIVVMRLFLGNTNLYVKVGRSCYKVLKNQNKTNGLTMRKLHPERTIFLEESVISFT